MTTLNEIYKKHEDGLKTIFTELEKSDLYDWSYPVLLSTWEGEPAPKAMFFGQETKGWCDSDTVEGLMDGYRRFNLGENNTSPFWQYLWAMSYKLGLEGKHPFLWNNINKFGRADSKGRPETAVTELENKYFNVLAEELEVTKPEVCVFFTGPNYDEDIKAKLPDVEFIPVEGYTPRQFVRLKSKYLPQNSFRTYHPGYGNREYDRYQGVLNKIVELSR